MLKRIHLSVVVFGSGAHNAKHACEGQLVLHVFRNSRRARPWIAALALCALVFQTLLTGITAAHSMAATGPSADELFVICHGSGDPAPVDQSAPGKPTLPGSMCALCALANASSGILPLDPAIATHDATAFSAFVVHPDGPVIAFASPTGRYQRGPPSAVPIIR
jgi:hypothetical protein